MARLSGNARRAGGIVDRFPKPDFTSTLQTVTVNTLLDVAHGLGAIPSHFKVYLVANTATAQGYSDLDRIELQAIQSAIGDDGVDASADATNITLVQGNPLTLADQTTFNGENIITSQYNWLVLAWK